MRANSWSGKPVYIELWVRIVIVGSTWSVSRLHSCSGHATENNLMNARFQQPKELFTIRQRQTPTQTRGAITLIGELDFETQSMYTLTIYATVRTHFSSQR